MTLDLNMFRSRLLEKQAELLGAMAGLTEAYPPPVDPIRASKGPQDFEEAAVDVTETEDEWVILFNESTLLAEVDAALKRIDLGTYGNCVDCGKPIPIKRLEALPWAARDVQCESQLEKQNTEMEA